MTHTKSDFIELDETYRCSVTVANNETLEATGRGTIRLQVGTPDGEHIRVRLDAILVPGLGQRLFSVPTARANGHNILFYANRTPEIQAANGATIELRQKGDAYFIEAITDQEVTEHTNTATTQLWHERLGHASVDNILHMQRTHSVIGLPDGLSKGSTNDFCTACAEGKATRAPISSTPAIRRTSRGELVHLDLVTMETTSIGGMRYAVCFTDDATRMRWIFFMKAKSEAPTKLREFLTEMKTEGVSIKCFRSDNGGEFTSRDFQRILSDNGIQWTACSPYTPSQNGVAERSWRTLVEKARTMLIQAGLPKEYWVAAMDTACYLTNRTSSSATDGETPFKKWYGKLPSISHLRKFGCPVYVIDESETR